MKQSIAFILLLVIFLSVPADARPAAKGVHTLLQPDGTVFSAVIRGDEFIRLKTTLSGHAIIQDADGWWSYAEYDAEGRKVSTGIHVGDALPSDVSVRSAGIPYAKLSELAARTRSLMADRTDEATLLSRIKGSSLHTKGEEAGPVVKHGIVILAQFANMQFKHEREHFVAMLTQDGYSEGGATGCAKEYFDAQFSDEIDFLFDVSQIVTLSNDLAYYGENTTNSNGTETDKAPEEMVMEACQLADQEIDFSLYDDDGDGQVDNVFIFFAGGDEAEGAGDDCIWSHAWYLRDGAGKQLELDGKVINRYACTAEMTRYYDLSGEIKQRLAGIGTFCHEYSHTFGLPDLYDTDYDGSGGDADALWVSTSLMDGGNQNNGCNTPPFFNAIEREILGLAEPVLIEGDGTYRLEPVHKGGTVYRMNTDTEGEYFLFECRAEDSWDAYIGGNGLLVYHIDKSGRPSGYSDAYGRDVKALSRWTIYNEVNCRPDHQCADLIEALPDAEGVRNVFYPVGEATSISAETLTYWSGAVGLMSVEGIRRDGSAIVFSVVGNSVDTTPPEPVHIAYERYQDAAVVTFESDRVYGGDATVSWGVSGREPATMNLKPYEDGFYALVLEGLHPRTSYTVSVSFSINGVVGKEGSVSFMTSSYTGGYPYIYLKNVQRNPDGSFPKGCRLPLRVYNAVGAAKVSWTFDGVKIAPDKSGFYKLDRSGQLKAVVSWEDGSEDVIIKQITVAE